MKNLCISWIIGKTLNKRYEIKATTYDKRGKVVAVAFNSYTQTHPMQAKYAKLLGMEFKQTLHAEIAAIIKSKSRKIHKIKIERYDSFGNPKLAKPCPICERAIKDHGISFVEYTVG